MDITVYVSSAFSKDDMGGNKAGVVLYENELTNEQKMKIAKDLGYAETAFITESSIADYKFEYFTPKEEVDLCGHATIGSFVILQYLDKLSKNNYTIDTKSGVLNIIINDDIIFMEQNAPEFYQTISPIEFSNCFDINSINMELPIQIVSTGLKDILIPIVSEEKLHDLKIDFDRVSDISRKHGVIGMHLYTFNEDRIICRNFAPLYEIDEEAATGTANGALACYLYKNVIKKNNYTFEQGYSLNSISEILVNLKTDSEDNIEGVYVGGRGYYGETKHLNF